MRLLKTLLVAFTLLTATLVALPAHAVPLWSQSLGDLNFPGLSPSAAGATTTPITAGPLKVDAGTKTATATGTTTATATLSKYAGKITSASLTTAAGGTYVLTLTNTTIAATDQIFASVSTAGTGTPTVASVVPGTNQVVITIQNIHASAAFNNTISISFLVVKN